MAAPDSWCFSVSCLFEPFLPVVSVSFSFSLSLTGLFSPDEEDERYCEEDEVEDEDGESDEDEDDEEEDGHCHEDAHGENEGDWLTQLCTKFTELSTSSDGICESGAARRACSDASKAKGRFLRRPATCAVRLGLFRPAGVGERCSSRGAAGEGSPGGAGETSEVGGWKFDGMNCHAENCRMGELPQQSQEAAGAQAAI